MNRKISPHVNIYKFPITALSSISTRLSGLYLTGIFLGSGIYQLSGKDLQLHQKYNQLENYQKKILNYSLILPTTYHTLGGIRHFIWDKYPQLLTNTKVARSSYLLIGLSLGITPLIDKLFDCPFKGN
jgi:succinate dehydrogenase (ubiquinone) cytochrome b560 subunit